MQIQPATASLVGESSSVWSQSISLPGAYLLVELYDENPTVAMERGNKLVSECMSQLQEPPIGLHETEKFISALSQKGVTSAILLTVTGTVAYISQYGDCASYVKRGGLLARLVTGTGSISGELKQSDTLLLVTERIKTILDEKELTHAFDHLSPSDLAEKLTLLLHERVEHFYGAGFIYHVSGYHDDIVLEERPLETITGMSTPRMRYVFKDRLTRVYRRVRSGKWPTIQEVRYRMQHAPNDSKKTLLVIMCILSVLFVISVVMGIKKISSTSVNTKLSTAINDATHAFDEGVALRDLNPLKSRERLQFAKKTLEPFVASISKGSKTGRDFSQLYTSIEENLTLAMQIYTVRPALYYDVSLLKQNAKTTFIASSQDTLIAVDGINATVYAVNIASKNGQIVAGGEHLNGVRWSDVTSSTVYVFTAAGIYALPLTGKGVKQPVIKADEEWGKIEGLITYGGNIYLLDSAKSRIWKYISSDTGFSARREYLTPDTLPDFSNVTNFAIDGSVWVGTSNGRILKFSQGLEQTFEPKGIEPALGQQIDISSKDSENNLYILDSSNNRVVVLDKEGLYIAQYVWNPGMDVSQFTVSEGQKKVMLLSKNLIYSFDLK